MLIRVLNTFVGGWLFLAAFLWPHTQAQFANMAIVGMLATSFGAASIAGVNWARNANAALGFWMFASALLLRGPSMVHNIVVAVLLVATSFVPGHMRVTRMFRTMKPRAAAPG